MTAVLGDRLIPHSCERRRSAARQRQGASLPPPLLPFSCLALGGGCRSNRRQRRTALKSLRGRWSPRDRSSPSASRASRCRGAAPARRSRGRAAPAERLGSRLVHVERGAGDQVLLERPGQRLFVDDRPARRVDRYADRFMRASARRRSGAVSSGVSGVWIEMTSELTSSSSSDARRSDMSVLSANTAVMPKAGALRRDGAADPAAADDAELLAARVPCRA